MLFLAITNFSPIVYTISSLCFPFCQILELSVKPRRHKSWSYFDYIKGIYLSIFFTECLSFFICKRDKNCTYLSVDFSHTTSFSYITGVYNGSSQLGQFCSTRDISLCLETFLIFTTGGSCYWHLVDRGQECGETSHNKESSGQNVNGAQVENLWRWNPMKTRVVLTIIAIVSLAPSTVSGTLWVCSKCEMNISARQRSAAAWFHISGGQLQMALKKQ